MDHKAYLLLELYRETLPTPEFLCGDALVGTGCIGAQEKPVSSSAGFRCLPAVSCGQVLKSPLFTRGGRKRLQSWRTIHLHFGK